MLFVCLQYAPFKSESKSTLVERAKAVGLEDISLSIVAGASSRFDLQKYVSENVEGLENEAKVLEGIQHIISHVFSKDIDVLDLIRKMFALKLIS